MTAPELLGLIVSALLLQLVAGIGWSVWRHRSSAAYSSTGAATATTVRSASAWAGWRQFRVLERRFEDAAQSQCSFYLVPVDGQPLPSFKPGQFLTFSLDVTNSSAEDLTNSRSITRCYSLSDRPDSAHYRVTIKRVQAPADHPEWSPGLSSNHFHDHVQPGDILRVKAPSGHFFIDPDPAVPVVLIGGGIGITPMMSMLRWCVSEQPQRTLHLYYGVRNSGEHAFKQVLEEIAASHPSLRLNIVYSRPAPSDVQGRDYQHQGHVDVELLRRTLPHGRHQFYVCGPPIMMQTLVPGLADWRVPVADIRYEAFGPTSVRLADAPEGHLPSSRAFEIQFQRSGRTLSWEGRDASLLDFAERHGIEVESGCRSGGCGSCETRLKEGSVQYDHSPDHDVAPGHCLLCVGRPSSDLVLEA